MSLLLVTRARIDSILRTRLVVDTRVNVLSAAASLYTWFAVRMASGSTSCKRKCVVLSIDDKIEIIRMIEQGSSLTAIAAASVTRT